MARGSGNRRGGTQPASTSTQPVTKPAKYSGYISAAKVFKLAENDSGEDLPERNLHNVEVYSKDFQKLKNLLHVTEEGPFHIFGLMNAQDDPHENCMFTKLTFLNASTNSIVRLVAPGANGYELEINHVQMYCINSVPFPEIWAQTELGYFKIVSSTPEYAPILESMKQGVEVFDALIDIEEEFQGSLKPMRIQDIRFKVRYGRHSSR